MSATGSKKLTEDNLNSIKNLKNRSTYYEGNKELPQLLETIKNFSVQPTFLFVPSTYSVGKINVLYPSDGSAEINFTRNSIATRVNSKGFIEVVPANIPRIDYDPVTKDLLGLWIEEGTENLSYNSEDCDNWSKSNTTVLSNILVSPDGTMNADVVSNTVSVNSNIRPPTVVLNFNTTYTRSIFAKHVRGNGVLVIESNIGDTYRSSHFNILTGQVIQTSANTKASIEYYGNGWYRCFQTFTTLSAGILRAEVYYIGAYGNTATPTSIGLWGAQLEQKEFASTYLPTTGGTKSVRDKEVLNLPVGSWYDVNKNSWYIHYTKKTFDNRSGINQLILRVGDVSNSTFFRSVVYESTGTNTALNVASSDSAGVGEMGFGLANTEVNKSYKVGVSFTPNDGAVSINGGTVLTDSTLTPPTNVSIGIGCNNVNGTSNLNGYIKAVAFFPRMTNSELQIISTP